MELGSCQYENIGKLVDTVQPGTPMPQINLRLGKVWKETAFNFALSLDFKDGKEEYNPAGYEHTVEGYLRWTKATAHDLWEVGFDLYYILMGDTAPHGEDGDLAIAIAIKTALKMGVPADAFMDYDT